MSKNNIKKIFFLTVASLALAAPMLALANSGTAGATPNIGIFSSIFGTATLSEIIVRVIQVFLAFLGFIVLVILMYAGFLWMTASGDPNKIGKAKQMIYQAVIGLVIILSAYAIVSLIWRIFGPTISGQHCGTIGAISGCSTNECNGTRICQSDNTWSPCVPDPDCDLGNNPFYGKKFANIFKFSDPSLPNWPGRQWGYKNYNSGVIALPKTDTLQLNSFAHNYTTFGAIVGLRLWEAKTTSTEQDFGPLTIATSGQYLLNKKPYYFAWSSATLTASTSITYSTTTLRVSVNDNTENDYYSKSVRVRFWPETCFNGIKDAGEKDIDCGGTCPNCDGDTCKRPELNVCDDSNCASEICNADCHCAIRPEIVYIDPALDVNNDTNRSNIAKESVDDDISNGATGTYITIFGRHFGNATGTIYFVPKNSLGQNQAPLALCAKSWSSNQIIATVPDSLNYYDIAKEIDVTSTTLANPLQNYEIFVQPGSTTLTSNNWDFQVNKIDRPGICQMNPNNGVYPATTTVSGHNFPVSGLRDVFWGLSSSTHTFNWTNLQVSDVVPENKKGRTSVRIYNGEFYSNYYIFLISAGGLSDPCGYDTFSCNEDIDTCQTGLNCQYCQNTDSTKSNYKSDCDTSKNCTCQHSEGEKCNYVSETDRDSRSCTIGGCPGTEYCNKNNIWSGACIDIVDGCVPFLGLSSTHTAFSWAFFANKNPFPGMSCTSDLWSDGTCDINGCIDKKLSCDVVGSAEEWVELYNSSDSTLSLNNYYLAYHDNIDGPVSDHLAAHYAFDKNLINSASNNLFRYNTASNRFQTGLPADIEYSEGCRFGSCLFVNQRYNAGNDGRKYFVASNNVSELDPVFSKSFTFSTWFYPTNASYANDPGDGFTDDLSGRDPFLISRGDAYGLGLHWQWDAKFVFTVFALPHNGNLDKVSAASIQSYPYSSSSPAGQRWYHLVGIYDNDRRVVQLYVDGVLQQTTPLPSWATGIDRRDGNYVFFGSKVSNRSIYTLSGKLDDIRIYSKALSSAEVSSLYQYNAPSNYKMGKISLAGQEISSKDYLIIDTSTLATFGLPEQNGSLALLYSTTTNEAVNPSLIDGITYGQDYIYPGYSPASIGRQADGYDNNTTTDFTYYAKSTPGSKNSNKTTAAGSVVINEISLSHDPCTCVPREQMCSPGKIDSISCPLLDQCKQVRKCQSTGRYGACELANPSCIAYPTVPPSTIATFAWSFNTNKLPAATGPIVVSGCMGDGSCNDDNMLPSPTPWGFRWNQIDHPELAVKNPGACLNSIISARFSQAMDEATINLNNIRVYRRDNDIWLDVTNSLVDSIAVLSTKGESKDYFKLNFKAGVQLEEDNAYSVFVSDRVKDQLGRGIVDDPNGVNHSYCPDIIKDSGVCWKFSTRLNGWRDRTADNWSVANASGRLPNDFSPKASYFYDDGRDGAEMLLLGVKSGYGLIAYRSLRSGDWQEYTNELKKQGLPANLSVSAAYANPKMTFGGSVDIFGSLYPNAAANKLYSYDYSNNKWIDKTDEAFKGGDGYLPAAGSFAVDTAFRVPSGDKYKIYVFGHVLSSGTLTLKDRRVYVYHSDQRKWLNETSDLLSGRPGRLSENLWISLGFYYNFPNNFEGAELWGKNTSGLPLVYRYDIARDRWIDVTADVSGNIDNFNNFSIATANYSNYGMGGGRSFYLGSMPGASATENKAYIYANQDLICPIGCINCTPQKYINRYFSDSQLHSANPISADNVCLMLSSNDYAWDWSEQEQNNYGLNWAIQTFMDAAKSWVWEPLANSFGIAHQDANDPGSGYATTTALRETNWRIYDETNLFSLEDFDYARINALEPGSNHSGSAKFHNNFIDPIVVENQHCTRSEDPAKRILQSPSPWKGQQDACINAVIFALFSRNMQNASLVVDPANGLGVLKNIEIYNCGTNESRATSTSYPVSNCGSNLANSGWKGKVFTYSHENISFQDLMNTDYSFANYLKPEGIRIYPNGNLAANSWYKVVIKGGLNGVRGGGISEAPEGTLQIPNSNALMRTGSDNSYYWYFKTGSEVCPIDVVNVLPQLAFIPEVGPTQEYEADPVADNCNHLNPFNYDWYWKSLINPFEATARCGSGASSGEGIATICALSNASCGNSDGANSPFVKAFSKSEGNTKITARTPNADTANCEMDKFGYGELQIGYGGFNVINHSNSECLNTDILFNFSIEANSATLKPNENVSLYRCNTEECDLKAGASNQLDLKLLYPAGWPNPNPQLSSRSYVMPANPLEPGKTYRLVLKGGIDGIKSFNGSELEKLNFNSQPVAKGETCDPSVKPWRPGDADADKCNASNCTLKSDIDLCGSQSQQCSNNGLLAYYSFDDIIFNRTGISSLSAATGRYVKGVLGKALNVKSNEGILVASTDSSNGVSIVSPNKGTVSVWARPLDSNFNVEGYGHVFYAGPKNTYTGADGLDGDNEFHISTYKTANNEDRGFMVGFSAKDYATGSSDYKYIFYKNKYKVGEWQHLAVTYSYNSNIQAPGNNLLLNFYVNGKLVDSTSTYLSVPPAPYQTVYAGRPIAASKYFIGDIDELAVYNRVLNAEEVSNLYSTKAPSHVIYGCNGNCKITGNIFRSSCGNGKVETDEECDDGNANSGDGCSVKCLLEGSNKNYGSVCGNGKVETGERCDDGNANSGDGCSDKCLLESGVLPGSYPNVSICGNGQVEAGEECDDGNIVGGDKCSASCLWEGSSRADTCGNGILDNGEFDSYSWTFKLADDTKVCEAVGNGLNPCPNGIWHFTASHSVEDLKVTAYKGSNSGGADCISDADMKKLGFWRRVINYIVKIVKSFFGLRSATAANFWCSIMADPDDMKFSAEDLGMMAKGNFRKIVTFNDGSNTIKAELIGYTQDNGDYKLNIIGDHDWSANTEYKFVVNYKKNGVTGVSTANITTFSNAEKCQLNGVRFDVWPRGLNKESDGFFCASDPNSGNPDECGRYTSDLYDDDMSAAWTKSYPKSGYDLHDDANLGGSNNYKPGNQHLYRFWAMTAEGYAVRANFYKQEMSNVSAETAISAITGTTYNGDIWVTSGSKPGRSIFDVAASDADGRRELNQAVGNLPILTFMCNNPWPDAKNFPFIDNSYNCTTGGRDCINTNFGTYYCRDAGKIKACVKSDNNLVGAECSSNADCWKNQELIEEGSCQIYAFDDLSSIGDFNALTGKLERGVVRGNLGNECQTLPNNFKPALSFDSFLNPDNYNVNYLWDGGSAIYKNEGDGWQKVDRGTWNTHGLPADFRPTFAYGTLNAVTQSFRRIYAWSNSAVYYYDGLNWVKDIELYGKLPQGFNPIGGYFGSSQQKLTLFNASGKLLIVSYSNGTISSVTPADPISVSGTTVYPSLIVGYHEVDGSIARDRIVLGRDGSLYQFLCNDADCNGGSYVKQSISGLPASIKFIGGNMKWAETTAQTSVVLFTNSNQYTLAYLGNNTWQARSENFYGGDCNNKLKEFLFTGVKPTGVFEQVIRGNEATNPNSIVSPFLARNDQEQSLTINNGFNTNQTDLKYPISIPEAGKYYVTIETSNDNDLIARLPLDFQPADGQYGNCEAGKNFAGRNFYQEIQISLDDFKTSSSTVRALVSSPSDRQTNQANSPLFVANKGNYTLSLRWINDCSCSTAFANCGSGQIDSNLRIYSIKVANASSLNTGDAIGLRMYNNNNHYSAALWYKMKFNPYGQINLSDMLVDGNKAVSEGRTVYVNAPDFSNNQSDIYSVIYLMSYNEGASESTQNIYKQMINNWFFNAGNRADGGLDYSDSLGGCSGGTGDANTCMTDVDCLKRGAGYCTSMKAKVTRDNIRLGDVQDIYSLLGAYYGKARCSNDQTRLCSNNSDCFGSGVCGNFYPNLNAGSYITNKSYSIWPSWQEALGKELGAKLPIDPLNLIWASENDQAVSCSDPYNPQTCWSDKDKKMACNIHTNSSFYAYYTNKLGTAANVYVKGEVFSIGSTWKPDWKKVLNVNNNPLGYNPFSGFNSQIPEGFCQRVTDACGNGSCVAAQGENCSTCPIDCACSGNDYCQKTGGNWSCSASVCGNGVVQTGEECDDGNSKSGDGCDSTCFCEAGYDCSGGNPRLVCGDGVLIYPEECEFLVTGPTCGTQTKDGQGCCNLATCKINPWAVITINCDQDPQGGCQQIDCPAGTQPLNDCHNDSGNCVRQCTPDRTLNCGDGIKSDQEECDCGQAGYVPAGSPPNPFICLMNNTDDPAYWTPTKQKYSYCNAKCNAGYDLTSLYCGDNIFTLSTNQFNPPANFETCDTEIQKRENACHGNVVCETYCTSICGANRSVFPDLNCANGCCWRNNDSVCGSECGETYSGTCASDCRECNAGDVCCDSGTCSKIRNRPDPNNPGYYCDDNGNGKPLDNGTSCGSNSYADGNGNCIDCNSYANQCHWSGGCSACEDSNQTCVCGNDVCNGKTGSICSLGSTNYVACNIGCCRNRGDNWLNEVNCGLSPGERFSIRFNGTADCGGTISNPYLSVNSNCGSGANGLNANVSINNGDRDRFDYTMINDNDSNGVLSRGDNIKLHNAGVNRNIKLSGVGALGTDWFNGNDDGGEIVFNVCDPNGCSSNGVYIGNGSTICLRFVNSRNDKGRVETDPAKHRPLKAVYGNSEYDNPCADSFIITSP